VILFQEASQKGAFLGLKDQDLHERTAYDYLFLLAIGPVRIYTENFDSGIAASFRHRVVQISRAF
jgi:hypothetical protein